MTRATTLNMAELIDKAVAQLRAFQLVHYGVQVADGKIPAAQAPILADIDANNVKALLHSSDPGSVEIAMRILRPFIESVK